MNGNGVETLGSHDPGVGGGPGATTHRRGPGATSALTRPDKLMLGEIGLHDLTATELAWWSAGYDRAGAEIVHLRAQLERAEHDADRYYSAAFGERPKVPTVTLAQLERQRGNPTRAAVLDMNYGRRLVVDPRNDPWKGYAA